MEILSYLALALLACLSTSVEIMFASFDLLLLWQDPSPSVFSALFYWCKMETLQLYSTCQVFQTPPLSIWKDWFAVFLD